MSRLLVIRRAVHHHTLIAAASAAVLTAACAGPAPAPPEPVAEVNTLTAEERAAGWELLFDGTDVDEWRGYQRPDPPAGWRIQDGTLAFVPGGERGDLVTREQFGDFDFSYEWKISEGGNSGVIYRATETEDRPWKTGPEMQVLDDAGHPDATRGVGRNRTAGALYDMIGVPEGVVRPAGEWNEARIVARGNHIEHWLNGQKVVEVEVGSDEWKRLYQASKFSEMPGFGVQPRGHIVLQDHGDPVWYRNLKIRRL